MDISVIRSEDPIAIRLGDRFDFGSVEQFRKAYEALADVRSKTIHIDFKHAQYMDSSALGMLINAKSFFTDQDVKLRIVNASDQIKKILAISRFDKKFEIQ